MNEQVIVRSLETPTVEGMMGRAAFYQEQIQAYKETGKPTKAVDVVNVFLFNCNGELLVQKRSFDKNHNPGLLDKSIGGHVRFGDTPDYTVMVETVQELQTPSIVLREQGDFEKTYALLKEYIETIAIVKYHQSLITLIPKVIHGETIIIANNSHVYFGVYNGKIRPVDREAKGVLWYSLKELKRELEAFPDTFSADVHFYLKNFGEDFERFTKSL